MSTDAKIKKWGNSLAIILPSELVQEQRLSENDDVSFQLVKKANFSHLFGTLKRKESGQKFKDEARKGWAG